MKHAIDEIVLLDSHMGSVFLKGNALFALTTTRVKTLWLPMKSDDDLIEAIDGLHDWIECRPGDPLGPAVLPPAKRGIRR